MSAVEALLARRASRDGWPILLGADPFASLGAQGVVGVPMRERASLGTLLRDAPDAVRDFHARELLAGVDVLTALTEETTAPALGRVGMAFRAAALTGRAVELADNARKLSSRSVLLAGVLAMSLPLTHDRRDEELMLHAARLAAAGCELILARAGDSVLAHAHAAKLAAWLIVEVDDEGRTLSGGPVGSYAQRAHDGGASALLIDAPSLAAALVALGAASKAAIDLGVLLRAPDGANGASGRSATEVADAWATDAMQLIAGGVAIVGGGAGATTEAVAQLAKRRSSRA
jgi:5-methyltetrahydrofolate--homocysteine methyltransferase